MYIEASEVTVRWLRFTGVDARRNPNGRDTAVVVRPGRYTGAPPYSPGPSLVANVQIVDDVFDNSGIPRPGTPTDPQSKGVYVGTQGPGGVNTHVSGITIARNTFRNYGDDAVGVLEPDSGATADGVVILDNTFEGNEIPIELGGGGNAPRITGTRIIGNTITGSGGGGSSGGINLDMNETAVNGTIDETLIEGNAISGQQGGAILLNAAAFAPSSGSKPAGDVISNTQIVNNVIGADVSRVAGIYLEGGNGTSFPLSRVSAVTIENDTLVDDQPGSLYVSVPNGPGASGNKVTDVTVRNSILYEPSGTPPIYVSSGPVVSTPPDVVMNSLISGTGWAGSNGNITGDPVDEPQGDYHLTAASPAINAGTTIGAPSDDLDGALRDAQPDIGAFEFGAVPRSLLTVTAEELAGSGTVTSSPAAINCGTACSARFGRNTTVTLTATPGSRSAFSGWSGGGCSGTGSCAVMMSSGQTVPATFIAVPSITAFKLTNTRFTVGPHVTAINARASAAAKPRKVKVPRGSAFVYTLSRASTATIVIQRQTPGRVVGRKCVAQTKANAKKKRCTITTRVGTLTRKSKTGRNTIAFSGRIGRKALAPASYRSTITARTGTGPTSKPRSWLH